MKTEKTVEEKQLSLMRVQTLLLAMLFLLLVGACFFAAKELNAMKKDISVMGQEINATLAEIDTKQISDVAVGLSEAAESLRALDLEKINGAVDSLEGAANNLTGLDIEALNKLATSLSDTADSLKSASDKIAKLFG